MQKIGDVKLMSFRCNRASLNFSVFPEVCVIFSAHLHLAVVCLQPVSCQNSDFIQK